MVPSAPAAPPTFSTTTVWPSSLRSCSAVRRAMMSVLPPAEKGTISLIVRVGYDCAQAEAATAHAATAAMRVFRIFIGVPCEGFAAVS
jgi:hypothetical protein